MGMRSSIIAVAVVAAGFVATGSPAAAQQGGSEIARPSFQIRTVSDLATLCGARAGAVNAEAAIYSCYGFLTGVGQYHAATRPVGGPRPPLFCPPNPPPSLAQVATGFTAWARGNPQFADERAVDGLVRWAALTYPCPPAPIPPPRRY